MPGEDVARILVVTADRTAGERIERFLRGQGHEVHWTREGEKALNRLDRERFEGVVLDVNCHGTDGRRVMEVARERYAEACVIFLAKPGEAEQATEALQAGAYDFQLAPINLEKMAAVLRRGLEHQRLVTENMALKRRLDERYGMGRLLGRSRGMTRLYDAVRQLGPMEDGVLICGEPGSGKNLIAQALHMNSPRRDRPFVRVDCAQVSEPLTRAELFGNSADADGGQNRARLGYYRAAEGGTLYLDGLGACGQSLRAEVAEAYRTGTVRRSGDGKRIRVDVRLLLSTGQRPYASGRETGTLEFLELFQGAMIEAPPLRDRPEDIPLLLEQSLSQANKKHGKSVPGFSREAVQVFQAYEWPGNVRELENTVDSMAVSSRSDEKLDVHDIPLAIRRSSRAEGEIRLPVGTSMEEIERAAIKETMRWRENNKEECAKTLGIGLRTLYRKLRAYAQPGKEDAAP